MSIISSRCALSHQVPDITSLITLWIRVGLLQRVPSVPVYIQIMLNVLHPSTEGLRGPAERWDPWHPPWFAAQTKTWKNVQSDHASAEACLRTEGSAASCSETRLAGNPGGGLLRHTEEKQKEKTNVLIILKETNWIPDDISDSCGGFSEFWAWLHLCSMSRMYARLVLGVSRSISSFGKRHVQLHEPFMSLSDWTAVLLNVPCPDVIFKCMKDLFYAVPQGGTGNAAISEGNKDQTVIKLSYTLSLLCCWISKLIQWIRKTAAASTNHGKGEK